MENKERISVRLTVGGEYKVSPYKAEFKQFGEYETISIAFSVELGYAFSCWVSKVLFFKSKEQIHKEVQYILKFIAPELLDKQYGTRDFKSYAEKLCEDINSILRYNRENRMSKVFMGKIRVDNNGYCNFEDLIPRTGDFIKNYLGHINEDSLGMWFTEWEFENCKVPFERTNKAVGTNISNGTSKKEVGVDPFEKSTYDDDLPF